MNAAILSLLLAAGTQQAQPAPERVVLAGGAKKSALILDADKAAGSSPITKPSIYRGPRNSRVVIEDDRIKIIA